MSGLNPDCRKAKSNAKMARFKLSKSLENALVIRYFFVVGEFYLSKRFNSLAGGIAETAGDVLGDAGVLEEDELDIVGLEVGVGLTDEAHEMHLLISGIVSLSAALQAENTKKNLFR